jgi:hypothetical protein
MEILAECFWIAQRNSQYNNIYFAGPSHRRSHLFFFYTTPLSNPFCYLFFAGRCNPTNMKTVQFLITALCASFSVALATPETITDRTVERRALFEKRGSCSKTYKGMGRANPVIHPNSQY